MMNFIFGSTMNNSSRLYLVLAALLSLHAVACDSNSVNPDDPEQGSNGNGNQETMMIKVEAVAATCTTDGNHEYWKCADSDKICTDETCTEETTIEAQMIPAFGHSYNDTVYTWDEASTTCTASRTCQHDETHIESETVTAKIDIVDPSCDVDGKQISVASFENDLFATQTKETPITALGHDFSEVSYQWSSDNHQCSAIRTCKRDASHYEMEIVTSTVEVTATCESDGETLYQAQFTNPAFESQTTSTPLSALGHSFGDVIYQWNTDKTQCTASRLCAHDKSHGETETVNVNVETVDETCEKDGKIIYTATFTNPQFEPQIAETIIPAIGHQYGEITYTWSETKDACTAARICAHDNTHVDFETAGAKMVTTAATCDNDGSSASLVATFTRPEFVEQTINLSGAKMSRFCASTLASNKLNGSGTKEDPYRIENARDLKYFVNNVNNKTLDTMGKHFALMTDIILDENSIWNPIGSICMYDEMLHAPFQGSFNGNGHTIWGTMNFDKNKLRDDSQLGFFGGVMGNDYADTHSVVIENLRMNAEIKSIGISSWIRMTLGSIVGEINSGIIRNCTNLGRIGTPYPAGLDMSIFHISGGIAGTIDGSIGTKIENCTNHGDIVMHYPGHVGGLVGMAYNNVENTLSHSKNHGNIAYIPLEPIEVDGVKKEIELNTDGIVGGLVGETEQIQIFQSQNTGTVNGIPVAESAKINGMWRDLNSYTGGLVGIFRGTLHDSSNSGDVTAASSSIDNVYAGGLVGKYRYVFIEEDPTSLDTSLIYSCSTNTGKVDGKAASDDNKVGQYMNETNWWEAIPGGEIMQCMEPH